jgi:hypothetical protein
MSLKLFLLNAFGGIKATSKIESEKESLWNDYQVFSQVEQSAELKEFLILEEQVSAESFKQRKAELKALKFKGSSEDRQLKRFDKLKRNKKLQRYYQTAGSADLKRYEALKEGNELGRYFELEKLIQEGLNQSDEKTKEMKAEYKRLKSSESVRFFHHYPKSSAFKNYLRMQHSEEKRSFEELKDVVGSDDFKNQQAYLEDPKKWEKTSEFEAEKRYLELKSKAEIILYQKYKNSTALDFFKNWEIVFEDRFDAGVLDHSKWKPLNYWAAKTVGKNFSPAGDLQAFTEGKNTHLKGARLQIQVKKEKRNSLVWNPVFGFVENEMDYSSDTLTTGGLFESRYGILEAKIKYNPDKSCQDVFYLAGENNSLRVNLFESGAKTQFGLSKTDNGKLQEEACSLSGLSAGKLYIFSMEWDKGKISWKINDKELFTIQNKVPEYPMFINLASLVISESNTLPHHFEVDWVRFYQKRQS